MIKRKWLLHGVKPDSSAYNPFFKIDVKPIVKKVKENKFILNPSAAAINPLTNELYILAPLNKLLVVADRNGKVKDVYPLDPVTFNQPEGVTLLHHGVTCSSQTKKEKKMPLPF